MKDIFISYSHQDEVFVTDLCKKLEKKYEIWRDTDSIRPAEDWSEAIMEGIEDSANFIFVLSPNSIKSPECEKELVRASAYEKKLIPLLYLDVEADVNNKVLSILSAIQQINFCSKSKRRKVAFEELCEAIETDLSYAREHTRFLEKMSEWINKDKISSALLRGQVLAEAEVWLDEADATGKVPKPTALQRTFIEASKQQRMEEMHLRELQHQERLARQLASKAQEIVEREPDELEMAVLLATEAMRRHPNIEAFEVLSKTLLQSLRPITRLDRGSDAGDGECYAHDGHVFQIAFSPSGKYIVTAGEDAVARIWDVLSGDLKSELPHDREVFAVAFSPLGDSLATGSWDGTAAIWDEESGQQLQLFHHRAYVRAVAFKPDGSLLATASWDKTAALWDVKTGKQRALLEHPSKVHSISFNGSGELLATVCEDGMVYVWKEVRSWGSGRWRNIQRIKDQQNIWAATFSTEGRLLATIGMAGAVNIWLADVKAPAVMRAAHSARGSAVAFSPDNQMLASGSADKTVKLWDVTHGHEMKQFKHDGRISKVVFSPDGRFLATACEDRTARLWDILSGELIGCLIHEYPVLDVAFSSDGKYLAAGSEHGHAGSWETTTTPRVATCVHHGPVHEILYSPNQEQIITTSNDEEITVWDVAHSRQTAHMSHQNHINKIACSPDGQFLLSACDDFTIGVWKISNQRHSSSIDDKQEMLADHARINAPYKRLKHTNCVTTVSYSKDGKYAATASWDGTAIVWDATNWEQRYCLVHNQEVLSVAFHPDGSYLITGCKDGIARRWSLADGKQLGTFPHEGSVEVVDFSQNGQYLFTICASLGSLISVWSMANEPQRIAYKSLHQTIRHLSIRSDGRCLALAVENEVILWRWDKSPSAEMPGSEDSELTVFTHERNVHVVAFSPDDTFLISGGRDDTVYIWNVAEKNRIGRIKHSNKWITALTFSPDGRFLVTGSYDGSVQVCLWRPQDLVEEANYRVLHNFSYHDWQTYLGDEPYRNTCTIKTPHPEWKRTFWTQRHSDAVRAEAVRAVQMAFSDPGAIVTALPDFGIVAKYVVVKDMKNDLYPGYFAIRYPGSRTVGRTNLNDAADLIFERAVTMIVNQREDAPEKYVQLLHELDLLGSMAG